MPDLALRRTSDVFRASLVMGSIVVSVASGVDSGWGMAIAAVVAIAVRRAPALNDLIFVALLALDSWLTAVGAFDHFNHGDHVGHFLLAAAVTPILLEVVSTRDARAHEWSARRNFLTATLLTFALGLVWEAFELTSDALIGTNMSLGFSDTAEDLLADLLGGVLGAWLVVRSGRRQVRLAEPLPDPPASPGRVGPAAG